MKDWNLANNNKVKALVVVAHPDDETIFCGGTILSNLEWEWKILCMTSDGESVRYKQLEKAVSAYRNLGVRSISCETLNQKDAQVEVGLEDRLNLETIIRKLDLSADVVLTHNREGEYGHPQHKALSEVVNKIYPNVWEFICPGAIAIIPQPFRKNIKVMPLSKQILIQKTAIFNNSYVTELNQWIYLTDLMTYEFKTGPEIFTSGDNNGRI